MTAAEPDPMRQPVFIAGDWGTSNLRLYLLAPGRGASRILDVRNGPGASALAGDFEDTFFALVDDWIGNHGNVPVVLSGMVGSTIGWHEAPYLRCPASARDIADGRLAFSARNLEFSIVAGLCTDNPLGTPDVMRGEELQLLGWLQTGDSNETGLVALPGTHNKWVLYRNGRVDTFLTALTGELYATLEKHSILVAAGDKSNFDAGAFEEGVAAAHGLGDASLVHALFATRSRQVLGTLPAASAPSYLSGLCIGADVSGAMALFRQICTDITTVTLIGESRLMDYYRLALQHIDISALQFDAQQAAVAGFTAVYHRWYGETDT